MPLFSIKQSTEQGENSSMKARAYPLWLVAGTWVSGFPDGRIDGLCTLPVFRRPLLASFSSDGWAVAFRHRSAFYNA